MYGNLFQRTGLIDQDVLTTYQEINPEYTKGIDMNRAKSEIALVDLKNNRIEYGVDSFAKILFHKYGLLLKLIKVQPFRFLSHLIYLFISLNRHIIVRPSKFCSTPICAPPLNRGYRSAYSIITALLTGLILSTYFGQVMSAFSISYSPYIEYLICFGQIAWQGAFIGVTNGKKFWDYLGHMSTVSLIGAFLLLPPLIISNLLNLSPLYLIGAFTLVVLIMIQEHLLRSRRLGLGTGTTVSWIAYRLFILFSLFIQFIYL